MSDRWDGPSAEKALAFLAERGYVETREWEWRLPTPDHEPTEEELSAIFFMQDEWDYGGISRESCGHVVTHFWDGVQRCDLCDEPLPDREGNDMTTAQKREALLREMEERDPWLTDEFGALDDGLGAARGCFNLVAITIVFAAVAMLVVKLWQQWNGG